MRKSNLVDEVDLIRSEDSIIKITENLVLLEGSKKAKQAEIAVQSFHPELISQEPDYDIYALVTLPTVDDAVEQLLTQARTVKSLEIIKEQFVHQRRALLNLTKPELYVNLSTGLREK